MGEDRQVRHTAPTRKVSVLPHVVGLRRAAASSHDSHPRQETTMWDTVDTTRGTAHTDLD